MSRFFQTGFTSVIILLLLPLSVKASPLQIGKNNGPTLNEQLGVWNDGVNNLAPTISNLFSAIFTLMFLFGAVRLGYSIVTKTGQVMKGSTGLLIWVPITFFSIRVLMLLLFTTNGKGVTLLASDFIRLITATSYSTVDWMISIGLIFYLFFHLIKHPEFGRWSKRMWGIAAVLTLLTILAPIVLGAV
ncbi:hypothetical protein [Robertmurraya sp. FSL R5-0851]|uniref:hypothetical protein n=1 Tax=Robertmurraya sp. FSL R5-0851 TaxID=2921584 RepID=UPI0030FB0266